MKTLAVNSFILFLLFITFSLTVFALEVRKINIQKDIYKKIPSKEYVFLYFKVLQNKNIVLFYKDKEEKNLNKIFISFVDTTSKKIIKTIRKNKLYSIETNLEEVKGANIGLLENKSFFTFDKNNNIISLQNKKQ